MNTDIEFKQVLTDLQAMRDEKQKDYADDWLEVGLVGNFYNIWRKFSRLQQKFLKGSKMTDANLLDTYIDMAVYCIFAIIQIKQKIKKARKLFGEDCWGLDLSEDQTRLTDKKRKLPGWDSPTKVRHIISEQL